MYVCLCNGFTDGDVRCATQGGACSVAEIYRQLGGPPQCARCVPYVRALVKGTGADEPDGCGLALPAR